MALDVYRKKRKFGMTPEPRGRRARRKGDRFVIQKHAARRLHYDLRLELDGVMKSWAVTRGPSLVPGEKRLAVHVEDHPIEYNKFEGTIPEGQYGAGTVMIWDRGRWHPEGDPHRGLEKGHLSFTLEGEKLSGSWHLVRIRGRPGETKENWLLIKARDEAARDARAPDILEQEPLSVASSRSMSEIAEGKGRKRVWHSSRKSSNKGRSGAKPARNKMSVSRVAAKAKRSPARTSRPGAARLGAARLGASRPGAAAGGRRAQPAAGRSKPWQDGNVRFTHPDRVYWVDVGVTKEDLANYYRSVWGRMAPHVVGRPLALVRCPDGTKGQCFFQKHVHAGIDERLLHVVRDAKGREVIAVNDLDGLLALVQAGVLEVHVRGSMIDDLGRCNRIVFDLDPGEEVEWPQIVAAARDVRERLGVLDVESFVKVSGGKGLHVVVPIEPAGWDETKIFVQAFAQAMAADAPERYVAKMTKSLRTGKVFIDYLRNSLEQTAVAVYSTRARSGAPVSAPIGWAELSRVRSANQYTVLNLAKRLSGLKQDPWADIGRVRQTLPNLKAQRKKL